MRIRISSAVFLSDNFVADEDKGSFPADMHPGGAACATGCAAACRERGAVSLRRRCVGRSVGRAVGAKRGGRSRRLRVPFGGLKNHENFLNVGSSF